jgi:hypothetical protein
MMVFSTIVLNKNIDVKLIKKKTNRHTYLRVKNPKLIEISSNIYFSISDAKRLIIDKKDWIENRIKFLEKESLKDDEYLFLGNRLNKDSSIKDLDTYYKIKSKEIIPKIIDIYSKKMNLHPTSIKYRKNKNTWGSCNYKNGLNFNTFLVKYPIEIVEYVVIHELAHIKHKNHSKKFWDLVEIYCPDYKQRMKLFKTFL